jgi:hypothetical protein
MKFDFSYRDSSRCSCFVYALDREKKICPLGTGFFISVDVESKKEFFMGYYVTAKHVIQNEGVFLKEFYIKMIPKELHPPYMKINVNEETFYVHEDKSVDLIVFSFFPDSKQYDFKYIKYELLLNKIDLDNKG